MESSCAHKVKNFMWLTLKGKIPTWEILKKKQFYGPSFLYLFKSIREDIHHLFNTFPFDLKVWSKIRKWLKSNDFWKGNTIEEGTKKWFSNSNMC